MNYKTTFLFVAIATFLIPSALFADDSPISSDNASNLGITVTGHAELDAKPDVAYASLGVVVQAPLQPDAISQDASKSDAVRQALIKAGVAESDIKTDYYQVQPQYDYRSSPPVLTGYQVSNFFKVAIHNLPKAGVIVDHATQAGANQVNDISYDLVDRSQVEGQALAAAVTNARTKADLIAGVAGVSVGRLLNITEGATTAPPPPYPMFRLQAAAAAPQSEQPSTPLKPQDIVISADVTALYAIGYGK